MTRLRLASLTVLLSLGYSLACPNASHASRSAKARKTTATQKQKVESKRRAAWKFLSTKRSPIQLGRKKILRLQRRGKTRTYKSMLGATGVLKIAKNTAKKEILIDKNGQQVGRSYDKIRIVRAGSRKVALGVNYSGEGRWSHFVLGKEGERLTGGFTKVETLKNSDLLIGRGSRFDVLIHPGSGKVLHENWMNIQPAHGVLVASVPREPGAASSSVSHQLLNAQSGKPIGPRYTKMSFVKDGIHVTTHRGVFVLDTKTGMPSGPALLK